MQIEALIALTNAAARRLAESMTAFTRGADDLGFALARVELAREGAAELAQRMRAAIEDVAPMLGELELAGLDEVEKATEILVAFTNAIARELQDASAREHAIARAIHEALIAN